MKKNYLMLIMIVCIAAYPAYAQSIDLEQKLKEKGQELVIEKIEEPIKDTVTKLGNKVINNSCDDGNSHACFNATFAVLIIVLAIFFLFAIVAFFKIQGIVKW